MKHIVDIHPVSDRLAVAVIKAGQTYTLNLITAYAPHAGRPEEEKESFYSELQETYSSYETKGPTWILGDMNARIVKASTEEERNYIGNFTFRPQEVNPFSENDQVMENRNLLLSFITANECILANTWFKKQDRFLATYRTPGTEQHANRARPNFEQLDYVIVPKRWRNSIKNAEADAEVNINTDHFPIIITCRISLRRISDNYTQVRPTKWERCNDNEWQAYNTQITEDIKQTKNALAEGQTVTWNLFKSILTKAAEQHIPKEASTRRRETVSTRTIALIEQRQAAIQNGQEATAKEILKAIKKSKRRDTRERTIEDMRTLTLDRGIWSTLRKLKIGFRPNPYSRRDKHKKHIKLTDVADASARHLAEEQWGNTGEEHWKDIPEERIIIEELECISGELVVYEVADAIFKMKRRKAAGPDNIALELLKELSHVNVAELTNILNEWWTHPDQMDEELWQARVALLFKKGNTADLNNYRPISLLNTIYKILAAIIKTRLERGMEAHLQKTQFGFRKHRGTAEAIHCVRRIIEQAEQTGSKTILLLLDWEKAFDKISHQALGKTLERMNVPAELATRIMKIYEAPIFKTEIEGIQSKWYPQKTGIRQGCPLSPYPFLIVMTAMFHDVEKEATSNKNEKRVLNTNFDEILYADDTICVSTDTKQINKRLAAIEKHGRRYGLKLNKDKCEVMTNATADVHFADGTKVTKREEVKYLGCILNMRADTSSEVKSRISTCMAIMQKMDLFWRKAECPIKWKILVFDAVIRSKLLYGLETAMLTDSAQRRLNVFQLKGLRKILKMKTTFVERANTNERVILKANAALEHERSRRKVKTFSEAYKVSRTKRCARLLMQRPSDPTRYSTLQADNQIWNFPSKRAGRPKDKWVAFGMNDLWSIVTRSGRAIPHRDLVFNTSKVHNTDNQRIISSMEQFEVCNPGELIKQISRE